jgi:regulator of protease activity HflC (stomatin/prohibitin superfamily)
MTTEEIGGGANAAMPRQLAESAPRMREQAAATLPGWLVLWIDGAIAIIGFTLLAIGISAVSTAQIIVGALLLVVAFALAAGLTPVSPGEARVVQLFGRYTGTIRAQGLQWVSPVTMRRRISTRVRNNETRPAKVNDADGNPIEIAAVLVWQVEDTAKAMFSVDDYTQFVAIQAETAVRRLAGSYPYDAHGDNKLSLRENADEITAMLATEIAERVQPAGVRVIEARLTRLAYAPEIAHAMLRRQQAGAVVAARQRIVDGAVGMVEYALARLSADGFVDLDEERKAAMVSNMLVVLCSEQATQPVVNTGTLYQ